MKPASPEVSNRVILLVLFSLINISAALPVPDGIPGKEPDIWHGAVVRKIYGPWPEAQQLYVDYNEYWTGVQDFQPGPEDDQSDGPEVAESGPADFQSDYGEAGGDETESDVPFQPSAGDPSPNYQDGDPVAGGDPANHELEGNVQWTSSVV